MQIETIHAGDPEELDRLVDEFMTDKIIYNVRFQKLRSGWEAHIFYDDILKGGEQHE